MTIAHLRSGFTDVDSTTDPDHFVRLLDTITAMDHVQAYKQRTFELLDAREGKVLLDLGCGNGDDVQTLARLVGPTGKVVGVDHSETMLAQAQARAAGSDLSQEFRFGDAQALDFPDAYFDGCRADRVLHHLPDPARVLAEMVRVVRPGAPIVTVDPDLDTVAIDAPDRELTRRFVHALCDTYRQGWMGRQVFRLFQDAGLTDVVVTPFTFALTDYALANTILSLEDTAAHATDSGILDEVKVGAWLNGLRAASARGRFFAACTGFIAVGRKP
jgi:ubiquinone/menaquinone biosynthesis C-methylase UbiE